MEKLITLTDLIAVGRFSEAMIDDASTSRFQPFGSFQSLFWRERRLFSLFRLELALAKM
jgi:hypothetical protein